MGFIICVKFGEHLYWFGVNVFFVLYWLLLRKKQLLLSLLILPIGYFVQGSFIKFFNEKAVTSTSDLSILTFNSFGFKGNGFWRGTKGHDKKVVAFINTQDADIVCFQEFDRRQIAKKSF